MRRLGVPLVLLARVAPAEAAAYTPPAVQYTGAIAGTDAFVGIVKRGDRFRAYVSDATATGATLSVWFHRYAGGSYRSGWIVLRDKRVRGRTTVAGTALHGTTVTGPGIRPNPSCVQLGEDHEALHVQRGRLLHQSGIWELRLNLGRGSAAAYRRLSQAIGALDEQVFELERYQRSAC